MGKKFLPLFVVAALLVMVSSCKKDDDTNNNNGTAYRSNVGYYPSSAGTYWEYDNGGTTYIGRVTNRDTTINGQVYVVMATEQNGQVTGYSYMNTVQSTGEVEMWGFYPMVNGSQKLVRLQWIKPNANVGDVWYEEIDRGTVQGFQMKVRYVFELVAKNQTKTVRGQTYTGCYVLNVKSQVLDFFDNSWADATENEYVFADGIGFIYADFGAFDQFEPTELIDYNIQ